MAATLAPYQKRDYSLTGDSAREAVEAMARSDAPAIRDSAIRINGAVVIADNAAHLRAGQGRARRSR